MRISLVSAFFPDMTQQIHSLRASGVMSSHSFRAAGVDSIAFRKSCGNVCTVPPAMPFLLIWPSYQIRWSIFVRRSNFYREKMMLISTLCQSSCLNHPKIFEMIRSMALRARISAIKNVGAGQNKYRYTSVAESQTPVHEGQ